MSLSKQRAGAPQVSPSVEAFVNSPEHVGVLTTVRPDGTLHTAPVRFTWDGKAGLVRVMTVASSRKARNLLTGPGGRVAICQVQGFTWVTLEGSGTVVREPGRVAEGVRRYAERYRSAPPNPPGRVVIEIEVDRVLALNT